MNRASEKRIGIIGGSGLRGLSGLRSCHRVEMDTPFGRPSDAVSIGEMDGVPIAFLQRHGPGHEIPPSEINYRANVAALRSLGCRQLLSISTVGSLRQECPPGVPILIDQFIDRTSKRESTFFGRGLVAHVPFGDPTCDRFRREIARASTALGIAIIESGTYVVMEGPQFSTRAESELHRQWGGTVIGMTAMPEAKLAREAEMCYALVAVPTDFDCWSPTHAAVTAGLVHQEAERIAEQTCRLVEKAVCALKEFGGECPHGCHRALEHAVMTSPDRRDPRMQARLEFLSSSARVKSIEEKG